MAPPSNSGWMGPEEKNFKTYLKTYANLTCMQNFKSGGQKTVPQMGPTMLKKNQ